MDPLFRLLRRRALEKGVKLSRHPSKWLERFAEKRKRRWCSSAISIPCFRYGFEQLAADAADAGVDGVLVTDAVDEVAFVLSQVLRGHGLDLISLIAPTTSDDRLERIAQSASGFIYAVSRAGVTGARSDTGSTAEALVARARNYTDLPIAVGFGISSRDQIREVWRYADAAVVGSAIVAEIERSIPAGDTVERVTKFVRDPFARSCIRRSGYLEF